MPYDDHLAERVSRVLTRKKVSYFEKKMFGGMAFMVDEKMCLGVVKEELMARIDPEAESEALEREGARPMDFTGRRMKGFVFVGGEGIDKEDDLEYWIDLALAFNPFAKASKKKKK